MLKHEDITIVEHDDFHTRARLFRGQVQIIKQIGVKYDPECEQRKRYDTAVKFIYTQIVRHLYGDIENLLIETRYATDQEKREAHDTILGWIKSLTHKPKE